MLPDNGIIIKLIEMSLHNDRVKRIFICRLFSKLFFLGFFICTIAAIAYFCKCQTDGFTVSRISSNLSYDKKWEVLSLAEEKKQELDHILDQSYHYLSKGAQFFVFVSQDHRYVMKFFRHHRLCSSWWMQQLPFAWARQHVVKREARLHEHFMSCKVAYEILPQETGMIFLHLNKGNDLQKTLRLFDRLGICHFLPLDQYEFFVQKKVILTYPYLSQLIDNGELGKAKAAIDKLILFFLTRIKKGVFDKDPNLDTNFGFVEEEFIQIDTGHFRRLSQEESGRDQIFHILYPLQEWLAVRSSELQQYFLRQLELL